MDVANVEYAIPDFTRMQVLEDQAFLLIDTKRQQVLPAAREQLDDLKRLIVAVERFFMESLVGGIVLLENREFVTRTAVVSIDTRLAGVISRLNQHHAVLAKQCLRLELFSLSALVQQLPDLEARTARLDGQVAAFDQRLQQQRQQQADIVQAITLFEKPSISSALKGLIPSEEEIAQIAGLIKDPKVDTQLLTAVVQKLTSHVDVLEGAKTFNDLIKVRAQLDVKISETTGDLATVKHALNDALNEYEAVKLLVGVEPLKQEWLQELRKVEHEWHSQTMQLNPMMDLAVAQVKLQDLCTYLQAVKVASDRR
ncbi:MAG: alpha-xenorhabdolysin family binary toxin subunit B [Pseudomonas capeferrum]